MKKQLILVAAILASTAIKAADWTKPVYSGSFQPLSTTDTVYIYNTESKMFLTEGNDWGTHASVGDEGILFAIKESKAEGKDWDGKTYVIRNYSNTKKGWKNMFITDNGGIYVDAGNTAIDTCFYFIDLGDNTYRITGADSNETWNAIGDMTDYMFGHFTGYTNSKDNVQTGTGVIYDYYGVDNNYNEGEFFTKWAFVPQSEYEAFQVKMKAYKTSEVLRPMLEQANAFGIDVADIQKVYDNTESTEAELNAAIDALNAKFLSYYEQSVTPDTPKDLTDMLMNASCDAVDGWTNDINATTWNTQTWIGDGWTGFEGTTLNIWAASLNGKVYQKLTGLPNGIYISTFAAYSEKMDGYVYANENKKTVLGGAAGNAYTITTEVKDGNLEIGFGQDTEGTNWVALDNASVKYYGSGVEAYRYWLNGLLESAPSYDEEIVSDALVEEYTNVLNSVNTVQTKEEILGIIPSYEDVLNRITININAYLALENAKNSAEAILEGNLNKYYSDEIGSEIDDIDEIINNHTAKTEEVTEAGKKFQDLLDEAQAYIWNMETLTSELEKADSIYNANKNICTQVAIDNYVKFVNDYEKADKDGYTAKSVEELIQSLYDIEFNLQVPATPASDENPVDYTAKISFPSFDNGAEGWTNDGFGTCGLNTWNGFADGEVIDKLYLNLWNEKAADVYQTLTGLPNGAYTFQISAFADAEGFQVYANENATDVKVGTNEDGIPCTYGNIYTINVIVTDGTLKIGGRISKDATVWAMLDNAKLTYFGTESQIITGISTAVGNNVFPTASYSVSGIRISAPQKGISIVRMSDGTVKKVIK